MLELSSISKSFADAQVLDNLNLTVAPGAGRPLWSVRLGKNHAAAHSRRFRNAGSAGAS
jgi:ABC-type uncharacterized transport system ATPase subunit